MVDILAPPPALPRETVASAVPSRKGGPKWQGWASQRNDAADYARLRTTLGPRLLPVRPAGRKALHVEGQLPLWPGKRVP